MAAHGGKQPMLRHVSLGLLALLALNLDKASAQPACKSIDLRAKKASVLLEGPAGRATCFRLLTGGVKDVTLSLIGPARRDISYRVVDSSPFSPHGSDFRSNEATFFVQKNPTLTVISPSVPFRIRLRSQDEGRAKGF
jgi:hypothetical protein